MTVVTHGADPEALRRLAEDMLNHAQYTLDVGIRTQRDLVALEWTGPDADRARQHWETVELPRIRAVSMALGQAAGHVLEQLREQLEASEAAAEPSTPSTSAAQTTGATPSGTTPASGPSLAELAERAKNLVGLLAAIPDLAFATYVIGASGGEVLSMTAAEYKVLHAVATTGKPLGTVLSVAGHVGTAISVWDAGAGLVKGDIVQAGSGLGGLGAQAVGGPLGAVVWTGGFAAGTAIYEGVQGTTYGDALEARNEMAFDTLGAGGMLIVPGNLALAAWDVLTGGSDTDGGTP